MYGNVYVHFPYIGKYREILPPGGYPLEGNNSPPNNSPLGKPQPDPNNPPPPPRIWGILGKNGPFFWAARLKK